MDQRMSFLASFPGRPFDPPADTPGSRPNGEPPIAPLELAVAELLWAVSRALEDERDAAEAGIQRAAALLDIQLPTTEIPTVRNSIPYSEVAHVQSGLAPWQIHKVSTHIVSNLGRTITNQELATVAGISIFHFARVFRRSFGDSPRRYILRRKIERAQGLMLTTADSLADVALDCGFGDQAHFGRLFRELIGESPGAWRRARTTGVLLSGTIL